MDSKRSFGPPIGVSIAVSVVRPEFGNCHERNNGAPTLDFWAIKIHEARILAKAKRYNIRIDHHVCHYSTLGAS